MPDTASKPLIRDGQPLLTRASQVRAASYNPETRTVLVSLGTGAPVERFDWRTGQTYIEILSLEPGAIRLDRLNGGAAFLESHNQADVKAVVGRFVKGSVRIEDGELVGEVRLSRAARHADTVADIIDGILGSTSVGYVVHRWDITRDEDTGIETRTASDWEPHEGSVVPVPADPTGGIRSPDPAHPTNTAPDPDGPATRTAPPKEEPPMSMQNEDALRAAREEGARAEAARQTEIRAAAMKVGLNDADIRSMLDDAAVTPDAARAQILDLIAERATKTEVRAQVNTGVTRDEGDNQIRALANAVEVKIGASSVADYARGVAGMRIPELARNYLRLRGIHTEGRSDREVCDIALRAPAAHSTSDFSAIFSNALNKKLQAAYTLSSDYTWWRDIATRQDFTDDRPRRIVSVSGLGVLPTITEGSEYQGLTQYDAYEEIEPEKKGGEFRLTLEMMTRDDLSAFARQSLEFAKSCQYTEHTMALAALTANMSDGKAVCHADHNNLSTSGGAPDITKIAELDAMLRAQTDGNGHVIGKGGTIGLFPVAQKVTVEQMYSDRVAYTDPADAPTVPLSASNRRYVPGLTTRYFLITGDPLAMEYGWVGTDGGPVVTQHPEYHNDSVVFHGRDWFGIGCVKFRDFACNPGA
jgi:hypothetical protein